MLCSLLFFSFYSFSECMSASSSNLHKFGLLEIFDAVTSQCFRYKQPLDSTMIDIIYGVSVKTGHLYRERSTKVPKRALWTSPCPVSSPGFCYRCLLSKQISGLKQASTGIVGSFGVQWSSPPASLCRQNSNFLFCFIYLSVFSPSIPKTRQSNTS